MSNRRVQPAASARTDRAGVLVNVTPGTILEPGLLIGKSNNFLAALATDGKRFGLAYADVTTGQFAATELPNAIHALAEIGRTAPAEILVAQNYAGPDLPSDAFVTRRPEAEFQPPRARRLLLQHFHARTLEPMGLTERSSHAAAAAGAIIAYLQETQIDAAEQLSRLSTYQASLFMTLDAPTLRSLEVFERNDSAAAEYPSLLATLDRTRTDMGGRMLRRWLRQPLLNVSEIVRRQELVDWLFRERRTRIDLTVALGEMSDLERLSGRARAKTITPREMLALGRSLELIENIRALLQRDAARLQPLLASLPACRASVDLIGRAIAEEDIGWSKQKEIIKEGFSEELDRLRALLRDGKKFLAEIEQRERTRTGIKSLRVGYNKVFGYYIEITKPNLHLVPASYTRKQTLTQAERFITLELKEHESLVVNAEGRLAELEASLFRQVCEQVGREREEILIAAQTIALLDTASSLAEVAEDNAYVRPVVVEEPVLIIREGRHPVIERALKDAPFVANDVSLGGDDAPQIALVTGPNMSGKSTFLRQAAIIVLMAQIGSFVPAAEARIGVCDRIFTRAGLYDRIGRGESTFMTEMIETANILHHATPGSLILMDELGRGTSTYDGLAVARSVLEYIHNHPGVRSRTLFATHYHELAELEELLPRLKNFCVEIREQNGELVFLHRIRRKAERSYGVYAARLAGLPRPVVKRAEELLGHEARGSTRKILTRILMAHLRASRVCCTRLTLTHFRRLRR
ncbi:MAG: DNA mismatch repair protein MutS [Pyrinomonadaceae bacterium]